MCDLPGHGGTPALPAYPYSAVAEAVAGVLPYGEEMIVVGHSYGGVIASLLASGRYGVQPASVVAAGVKVRGRMMSWPASRRWPRDRCAGTTRGRRPRPVPQGVGVDGRCHG